MKGYKNTKIVFEHNWDKGVVFMAVSQTTQWILSAG